MLRPSALIALLIAGSAHAQPAPSAANWEFGARYWPSSGRSERSHNAQGLFPDVGNPTSVLVYDEVDAHALELHARLRLPQRWFVRGNAGVGTIGKGLFDDEDFLAGQLKETDTTSAVKGNRLAYSGIDLGREVWAQGGATISLFAGYHYWNERLDAYGVAYSVLGGRPATEEERALFRVGETVPAISNDVTWQSLRLGVAGDVRFDSATRLAIDIAWVPYARVRDEDSHWLRTAPDELGPAPNIIMDGRGRGLQIDVELRYAPSQHWELGLGFRHWYLRSTNGERIVRGLVVPMTKLESQRLGALLSLTRRW